MSIVLDRYGHLLPGSENRVNEELDRMAKGFAPVDTRRTNLAKDETEQDHDPEQRPPLRIVRARIAQRRRSRSST